MNGIKISKVFDSVSGDEFEEHLRSRYPFFWRATLFGPIFLTIVVLASIAALNGFGYLQRVIWTGLVTFFFFGRFVILSGADPEIAAVQGGISAEFLFLMVFYMDLMVATVLVFHAGFLFKIPWIGKRLADLANDGHFILKKNPWMRRATLVGLIAFVTFPLAATGSIGGAIFSRILGMNRTLAFMGIALGSLLGCSLMYFGSQVVNKYLARDNPFVTVGGISLVVIIILGLNLWYRRIKNREIDESQ